MSKKSRKPREGRQTAKDRDHGRQEYYRPRHQAPDPKWQVVERTARAAYALMQAQASHQ